jgi:hypothetical protein
MCLSVLLHQWYVELWVALLLACEVHRARVLFVVVLTLQLVAAVLMLLVPGEDHEVVGCSCYSYILLGCCFASVTDERGGPLSSSGWLLLTLL